MGFSKDEIRAEIARRKSSLEGGNSPLKEFDRNEIQKEIARRLSSKPQNYTEYDQEGVNGSKILSDVIGGAANVPLNYLNGIKSLAELPSQLKGIHDNPNSRLLQNALAGFGKMGHGILSAAGNARDWGASRGLFSKESPSFRLPESILPRDFDYHSGVGLEDERSGDSLVQSLAENIPSILSYGLGFAPLAATASAQAIGRNENPVEGALTAISPKVLHKIVPPVARSLSSEGIGKRLLADKEAAIKSSSSKFNDEFAKARYKGINKLKLPDIETKDILESLTKKDSQSLIKALQNPTPKNVHKAQSDLGYFQREWEPAYRAGKLPPGKVAAYDQIIDAKTKLLNAMSDALGEGYDSARAFHRKEVIPYKSNIPLSKFESKQLRSKNLVRNLSADDKFMLSLGERYPEIGISNATSDLLNLVGFGTKRMDAASALAKLLKGVE